MRQAGQVSVELERQSVRMEALGAATAGVVHDLNNEMMLVLNHLAVCYGAAELPEKLREHILGAQSAAARCAAMMESLLTYSKGKPVKLRELDLAQFVRDYAAELNLPSTVLLGLDLTGHSERVTADSLSLRRILDNLVSNACTAMNLSGVITISVSDRSISVRDSGPGIASKDLSRIFKPFFTTRGSAGTGLGLAVVRRLMRDQGGSVTVRSLPGHGACFRLRFQNRPQVRLDRRPDNI